jgi:phospholipid/cholesterol/gamma-HCH transport system permease protein
MNAALDCTVTPDDTLAVTLTGDWLLDAALPGIEPVTERLRQTPAPAAVSFDTTDLGAWDTGLIARLVSIRRSAEANNVPIDDSGLPEGARQLIELAFAVREREGARRKARDIGLFQGIGEKTLRVVGRSRDLLAFVGELMLSLGRLFRGKATYLRSDLVQYIQEAGAEALPIVSLISFLIGMIFAFVGVMQLQNFGAGIYTADLVAVAMVREMAPIMTAIIMAGRTGAAYAAQIGTMKVNEEVDALTTLGMDPVDFLVMPRVIALIIMLPMLTLYGSLMGILGGTFVGLSMLDVSLVQYISAMAVGESTTRAVVMGIVLIVVSASILTVIYINLGI